MAFRRKEVKKASYYVWFLGAMESRGLRGEDHILPVLHSLLEKERESEPSKVTLQVSNKGVKIIQNVPKKSKSSAAALSSGASVGSVGSWSSNAAKTEQIKHFIPHHAITCASQEEDIVSCILLIYNPITKCPVHVHSYRCDSIETANALNEQLQVLVERPDNQKKFREIEKRLAAKGLNATSRLPTFASAQGMLSSSDGRSTRTEGSEDSYDSPPYARNRAGQEKYQDVIPQDPDPKLIHMYDSLAAELRTKLGSIRHGPILLPPRDYDTISRKQGRLNGIEYRKSTVAKIVGKMDPLKGSRSESSGKSSGIGSDEGLPVIRETRRHSVEKGSSSDPEAEDSLEPWPQQGHWSHGSNVPPPVVPDPVEKRATPSAQTPRYYFQDPHFGVTPKQRNPSEVALKRQQSNPDCFRRHKPGAPPLNEQRVYRNSMSPEPYRLNYSQGSDKKADFREKVAQNKRSFLESNNMRKSHPISY